MTLDFSKPITTRDGRAVRILCTDGPHPEFTVIGICAGDTSASYWALDGEHCTSPGCPALAQFDLINPPVKRRGWVNIWQALDSRAIVVGSVLWGEKDSADKVVFPNMRRLATVQLPEWEEKS